MLSCLQLHLPAPDFDRLHSSGERCPIADETNDIFLLLVILGVTEWPLRTHNDRMLVVVLVPNMEVLAPQAWTATFLSELKLLVH